MNHQELETQMLSKILISYFTASEPATWQLKEGLKEYREQKKLYGSKENEEKEQKYGKKRKRK